MWMLHHPFTFLMKLSLCFFQHFKIFTLLLKIHSRLLKLSKTIDNLKIISGIINYKRISRSSELVEIYDLSLLMYVIRDSIPSAFVIF
jgi:hypothetical protein